MYFKAQKIKQRIQNIRRKYIKNSEVNSEREQLIKEINALENFEILFKKLS